MSHCLPFVIQEPHSAQDNTHVHSESYNMRTPSPGSPCITVPSWCLDPCIQLSLQRHDAVRLLIFHTSYPPMREIEPETRYRRRSLIGSRSTRSSSPELDSVNALVLRLKIPTSKGFLRLYGPPDYQRGYNESLQCCLKSTKIRLYVQLDVSYLYRFTHLNGDFSTKCVK